MNLEPPKNPDNVNESVIAVIEGLKVPVNNSDVKCCH